MSIPHMQLVSFKAVSLYSVSGVQDPTAALGSGVAVAFIVFGRLVLLSASSRSP